MFCFLFLIVFLSLLFCLFVPENIMLHCFLLKLSCGWSSSGYCSDSRFKYQQYKEYSNIFLYFENIFLLKLSCGWSSSGYCPHSRFNVKYRHSLSSLYSICSCISRDTNYFLLLTLSFWFWGVTLTSLFPFLTTQFPFLPKFCAEKLFGQCPYTRTTFQKGASLSMNNEN